MSSHKKQHQTTISKAVKHEAESKSTKIFTQAEVIAELGDTSKIKLQKLKPLSNDYQLNAFLKITDLRGITSSDIKRANPSPTDSTVILAFIEANKAK